MNIEPSGSNALDRILARLDRVRKIASRGWVAACPAHEDTTPSLSLTVGADRQVLMLCRASCPTDTVLAAIGLTLADLFEPSPLRRRLVAAYDYRGTQGELLYQVCRYEPKDFRARRPARTGWSWSLGDATRVPYRLPELVALPARAQVIVVEGEKDADSLAAVGLVATTNVGGAGNWRSEYGEWLQGRDVVIIPDNDPAGRRHADLVAVALTGVASSVRICTLPGLRTKGDTSDWLDAGGTRDELLALIAATPPLRLGPSEPDTQRETRLGPDRGAQDQPPAHRELGRDPRRIGGSPHALHPLQPPRTRPCRCALGRPHPREPGPTGAVAHPRGDIGRKAERQD